jgi:hypothetical protein
MPMRSSLALIPLALVLTIYPSFADQPRYSKVFRSPDGAYELRLLKGGGWNSEAGVERPETWGLFESATGSRRYEITGSRISAQSVYFAPDASALVAVDDYSSLPWSPSTQVLTFYNATTEKSYSLGELLSDRQCVSRSASHFHWFFGMPRSDGNLISLTTYELTTYTFKIASGELVTRTTDPRLAQGALYVYGPIIPLGHDRYRLHVTCPVSAGARCRDEIEFECQKSQAGRPIRESDELRSNRRIEKGHYYSVIIHDGVCVGLDELLVNTCNCQG